MRVDSIWEYLGVSGSIWVANIPVKNRTQNLLEKCWKHVGKKNKFGCWKNGHIWPDLRVAFLAVFFECLVAYRAQFARSCRTTTGSALHTQGENRIKPKAAVPWNISMEIQ